MRSADDALKAWAPSQALSDALMDWLHESEAPNGPGGDPDRHTIKVKAAAFAKVAGDDWPRTIENADKRPVSRRELFDIAAESRVSGSWFPLLTASFAWGYGNTGYGPSRLAKILQVNGREPIIKALDAAVAQLDMVDAEAAYDSFMKTSHIKHLGPAFFTKFLYFAGAKTPAPGDGPLIMDAQVAASLRRVAAHVYGRTADMPDGMAAWLWPSSGWGAPRYGKYLRFAIQTSFQLHNLNEAWPDLPDLLELAMFDADLRKTGIWDRV